MKIAFLGGGHITRAMVAELCKTAQVIVADRNADKRRQLAADFNIETCAVLPADLTADAVALAVRPAQALDACKTLPAPERAGVLLSVVAGLRIADIARASGRAAGDIIRLMPNTPAQVGVGMTFGYAGADVAAGDKALAAQVGGAVGMFDWVDEERLLDSVTAVAGSAPAYIYYVIEAMQAAAAELGLNEQTAQAAIVQTIRGACAMVEQGDKSPAALADAVAVPGGTTARALDVFRDHEMRQTIIRAMHACAARAREMGDELAK